MGKISNILRKNISLKRSSLKLKQSDLAELINLSTTQISRIETGASNPSNDTVEKIASALGVSVEELYKDPNEQKTETRKTVGDMTLEELKEAMASLSANNHALEQASIKNKKTMSADEIKQEEKASGDSLRRTLADIILEGKYFSDRDLDFVVRMLDQSYKIDIRGMVGRRKVS